MYASVKHTNIASDNGLAPKMHLKMPSAKWWIFCLGLNVLTQWGRVTHICVGKLNIIASDNGLSPGRCQAIIWTNAGILLIEPLGTKFNETLIEIHTFSFKKMHLKMSSAKRRPFCLGPNVLRERSVRDLQCLTIYYVEMATKPCFNVTDCIIDQFHKSQNTLVPYPTMLH